MPSAAASRRPRRAEAADAVIRGGLDRLLNAIDSELDRRRIDAELEPGGGVPVDIDRLSSIRSDLPGLAGVAVSGLSRLAQLNRDDLERGVRGTFDMLNRRAERAAAHRRGEVTVDEFGFDEEWTEQLLPFFRWLYRNWWRVSARGLENVPADGRVLLVANHAGVLPWDGAMIRAALLFDHPAPRHARALVLDGLMKLPQTSWLMRRTGNTLATEDDAERMLRNDLPVLVFPEGAKGTGKAYRDRYRLRRFGRGGFAEIAIRAAAPIVPVSVVGSEEIMPMLADIGPLAKLLGLPYLPVTPTFPLLGPLGAVPLPTSWVIEFHPPITTDHLTARDARDPAVVLALSDRVRGVIQQGVWRNLERRGSVFGTPPA